MTEFGAWLLERNPVMFAALLVVGGLAAYLLIQGLIGWLFRPRRPTRMVRYLDTDGEWKNGVELLQQEDHRGNLRHIVDTGHGFKTLYDDEVRDVEPQP